MMLTAAKLSGLQGDIVYKAAGGKTLPAGRGIARAVAGYFANLDAGARRSDARLAELLFEPILATMKREARRQLAEDDSLKPREVAEELVTLAKIRALQVAQSVNGTTADIVEKGEADPYSASRVAQIGITEANYATHASQEACLSLVGVERWTWAAHANACKECKELDGKTVKVGDDFAPGVPHPPHHPHCFCTTKRAKR